MAVKDHSLDEKIIKAARNEFLDVGYRNASMRKIAARAGITTGALYTRYENKDVLFASMIYETGMLFEREFSAVKPEHYLTALKQNKFDQLARLESGRLLDIIYSHLPECYMLFCCSEGSTAEKYYPLLVQNKAKSICRALGELKGGVSKDTIEMLVYSQYSYYVEVLRRKYVREDAEKLIASILRFTNAGWKELYRSLNGD